MSRLQPRLILRFPDETVERECPHLTRRGFLVLSAGVGLPLAAPPARAAWPAITGPVLQWVGRFAYTVGAGVVANLVSTYVQKKLDELFGGDAPPPPVVAPPPPVVVPPPPVVAPATPAQRIKDTIKGMNFEMAEGGFTDRTQSTVYGNSQAVFYPAVHRNGYNSCVGFVNTAPSAPQPRIGMVEGPTVMGLAKAAEDFKGSPEATWHAFFPRRIVRQGSGIFTKNYSHPDELRTAAGRVTLEYKRLKEDRSGRGEGEVTVIGQIETAPEKWGRKFFDRTYPVRYQRS